MFGRWRKLVGKPLTKAEARRLDPVRKTKVFRTCWHRVTANRNGVQHVTTRCYRPETDRLSNALSGELARGILLLELKS